MRSNLATGLDTAKGLAVAWQIPLVGVHHMQAHALTPRLHAAMNVCKFATNQERGAEPVFDDRFDHVQVDPDFPFLSVLVSGGHTLLVSSSSLTDHDIMGSTTDIAIGECLDKIARVVLPSDVLEAARTTMYGALLEEFAFPGAKSSPVLGENKASPSDFPNDRASTPWKGLEKTASEWRELYDGIYDYDAPKNNEDARNRNVSQWGWALHQPLVKAAGGLKIKSIEMSFSGLTTAVERIVRYRQDPVTKKWTKEERAPDQITIEERKDLAKHAMRVAFEHLTAKIILGLNQHPVKTIVMSGGVAANSYLAIMYVQPKHTFFFTSLMSGSLSKTLCAHGYGHVKLVVPPPSLCCDNAAMIAWAGVEMFKNGARDQLDIRAVRKWPLDRLLSPPSDKTPRSPSSEKPVMKS